MPKSVWLKDLYKLEKLLPFTEDKKFREMWAQVKQRNKERLAHHVQTTLGLVINTAAMFDVQIKVGGRRWFLWRGKEAHLCSFTFSLRKAVTRVQGPFSCQDCF
jgi:hypothetical protein